MHIFHLLREGLLIFDNFIHPGFKYGFFLISLN